MLESSLFCEGECFKIYETEDAKQTWENLRRKHEASEKACFANLLARIKKFSNKGTLRSPEQINDEGDGFYAIKARCGLRAYFWYHPIHRQVVFISHFILKKKQKLDAGDKKIMLKNRKIYQEIKL